LVPHPLMSHQLYMLYVDAEFAPLLVRFGLTNVLKLQSATNSYYTISFISISHYYTANVLS